MIQGVLWLVLFLLLKSSPQVQHHLPLPDGGLLFACCKAQPMQIRWGADFGAAKLAVCKWLWERSDAAALRRAVLNAKLNIRLGLTPDLELCWRESKGNKKTLSKLEALKPFLSSGFPGLLKRKQFILRINKRERDKLAAESPMLTPVELGCAPTLAPASEGTPGHA